MPDDSNDVTRVLQAVRRGDEAAVQRLVTLLYDELRELAQRAMAAERADHTLEPTALVHEAYLRLVRGDDAQAFENRAHFFAAAATAIRRVLVEHARRRLRLKRGGDRARVQLDDVLDVDAATPVRDERVVALDDALEKLASFDRVKARLVELRYFAGMSVSEAALALGVSESTIAREWRVARAWLQGELQAPPAHGS